VFELGHTLAAAVTCVNPQLDFALTFATGCAFGA
jgi:hypothetical protein